MVVKEIQMVKVITAKSTILAGVRKREAIRTRAKPNSPTYQVTHTIRPGM